MTEAAIATLSENAAQARFWKTVMWISLGLIVAFPVLGYLVTEGIARWRHHEYLAGRRPGGLKDLSTIFIPIGCGLLLGLLSFVSFVAAAIRMRILKYRKPASLAT